MVGIDTKILWKCVEGQELVKKKSLQIKIACMKTFRTLNPVLLSFHMITLHTYVSQIQCLSVDSWIWNKALSVTDNTHTCKRQQTQQNTWHRNNQYNRKHTIRIYIHVCTFKSHVNIDYTSYIKILCFMGDIFSMRETIFKTHIDNFS
jgi:hypothetical protein